MDNLVTIPNVETDGAITTVEGAFRVVADQAPDSPMVAEAKAVQEIVKVIDALPETSRERVLQIVGVIVFPPDAPAKEEDRILANLYDLRRASVEGDPDYEY